MKFQKVMSPVFSLALFTVLFCSVCTSHNTSGTSHGFGKGYRTRLGILKANKLLHPGFLKYNFGELDGWGQIYGTDKTTGHHYTEVYEYFLCPLKYNAKKILEIGIEEGGSLKMWADYFPRATVYGIDIADKSKLNSKTIKTFVADQADRKMLQNCINSFGDGYNLILDDGGHSMEQQQVSFGFLLRRVKPGGYYIIEDVHTSIYSYYDT